MKSLINSAELRAHFYYFESNLSLREISLIDRRPSESF